MTSDTTEGGGSWNRCVWLPCEGKSGMDGESGGGPRPNVSGSRGGSSVRASVATGSRPPRACWDSCDGRLSEITGSKRRVTPHPLPLPLLDFHRTIIVRPERRIWPILPGRFLEKVPELTSVDPPSPQSHRAQQRFGAQAARGSRGPRPLAQGGTRDSDYSGRTSMLPPR